MRNTYSMSASKFAGRNALLMLISVPSALKQRMNFCLTYCVKPSTDFIHPLKKEHHLIKIVKVLEGTV